MENSLTDLIRVVVYSGLDDWGQGGSEGGPNKERKNKERNENITYVYLTSRSFPLPIPPGPNHQVHYIQLFVFLLGFSFILFLMFLG
jgi:hypothetical protein